MKTAKHKKNTKPQRQRQTYEEPDARWTCPLCHDTIDYHRREADTLAFHIVHHLAHRHGWTRRQVLSHDPSLRQAADEYLGFPASPETAGRGAPR